MPNKRSPSHQKPDELFYIEPNFISDNFAELKSQEAIHCLSVLRYKVGDTISFTDAESTLYSGKIQSAKKSEAIIEITDKQYVPDSEVSTYPILIVGALKNKDRQEWLIEKAVELGVQKIILVKTERSEKNKVRLDRLQGIAIAAMKQSKRLCIPDIVLEESLSESLLQFDSNKLYVAHEKIDTSVNEIRQLELDRAPVFVIGPEGGFSDEEIDELVTNKTVNLISLGDWRLRAETAAIMLLSSALASRIR